MTVPIPVRELWLDAHLSRNLAPWITKTFGIPCRHAIAAGVRHAGDDVFFEAARRCEAVVLTKDADFRRLLERHGPPPAILLLRCGNTSNTVLKRILTPSLTAALGLIRAGAPLVELGNDADA